MELGSSGWDPIAIHDFDKPSAPALHLACAGQDGDTAVAEGASSPEQPELCGRGPMPLYPHTPEPCSPPFTRP